MQQVWIPIPPVNHYLLGSTPEDSSDPGINAAFSEVCCGVFFQRLLKKSSRIMSVCLPTTSFMDIMNWDSRTTSV